MLLNNLHWTESIGLCFKLEAQSLLEEARQLAEVKGNEQHADFKQQLLDLEADHEKRLSEELEQLRVALQVEHTTALYDLEQRLLQDKQTELKKLKQEHAETVSTMDKKVRNVQSVASYKKIGIFRLCSIY